MKATQVNAGGALRSARPGEARILSEIAFRAKAHWGYEASLLEACRHELELSEEDLVRYVVTVGQ